MKISVPIAFLAAMLSAGFLTAQTLPEIRVDVLAKELPPGAKLHVEMTAQYVISEMCRPAKGEDICYGGEDRFSMPAQGRLVWDFQVTGKQNVGKAGRSFVFSKAFKKAPDHLLASIILPTKVRLELPDGKILEMEETPFGLWAAETKTNTYYRCLRVTGSPKPLMVNIAKSCDAPYKPGISIPASRMTGRKP